MATYTTVATFNRDVWSPKDVDVRFIQTAATMATAYIDAALNASYTVPFSTTYPPIIVTISDLLTKLITENLVFKGPSPKVRDIEEAGGDLNPIAMLRDIASGKISIPGLTRLTGTQSWVSTGDQMHIFDLDHPIAHEPDSDRLDDIDDDRVNYP